MMAGSKGRDDTRPEPSSSSDDALSNRLRDLDRRIDASRPLPPKSPLDTSGRSGAAVALRYGADFVAAVVIGAALGYGADRLFASSPWGLIVGVLLGFAAGVLNVMRSAGMVRRRPDGGDDFSSLR
jgi:ATP synthase protein I